MNPLRKKAEQCSTKTIWLPASQKGHYCGTDMHMPTGGVPVHHYLLLVLPLIELPWIWLTTNSQVRCWQHYIWESAWTSGKSNISQHCPWRITSCVQNANIPMIAFKKSQTINNPTEKKKGGKEKPNWSSSRGMHSRKSKNQADECNSWDLPATPVVGCSIFGAPLRASKVSVYTPVPGESDFPLGLVPG